MLHRLKCRLSFPFMNSFVQMLFIGSRSICVLGNEWDWPYGNVYDDPDSSFDSPADADTSAISRHRLSSASNSSGYVDNSAISKHRLSSASNSSRYVDTSAISRHRLSSASNSIGDSAEVFGGPWVGWELDAVGSSRSDFVSNVLSSHNHSVGYSGSSKLPTC